MTMKRIALMAGMFWLGAFVPGAIGVWLDIYWFGHPSPHSTTALFQLQMLAALVLGVIGALCYGAGLVLHKMLARSCAVRSHPLIIALVSGVALFILDLWLGMGVPRRTPENPLIGWSLTVLVPLAASRLVVRRGSAKLTGDA
jgi:hypothetical protein